MCKEKEIIGYKCPMDLFGGLLKKGTIYYKTPDVPNAYQNGNSAWRLPAEIVEAWDPVVAEQFKEKQWVRTHDNRFVGRIKKKNDLSLVIDMDGDSILFNKSEVVAMTKEEIKSHLISEAEKRGYKKGVKVRFHDLHYPDTIMGDGYMYKYSSDILSLGGTVIRVQDGWAEIIKDELTFGGNVVEIKKDYTYGPVSIFPNKMVHTPQVEAYITCKGEAGTYSELKKIYDEFSGLAPNLFGKQKVERVSQKGYEYLVAEGVYDRIKIGCVWGTMDEIKTILDACEKLMKG